MQPLQSGLNDILTDVSLGTWIGFVVTLITTFGLLIIRWWRRRVKLRRSLIAELEQQDLQSVIEPLQSAEATTNAGGSQDPPPVEPSELPPAGTLPTHIYESKAGNLGILSSDEVTDIVEYYSTLLIQKAIIKSIRTDEDAITADQKELRDTMPGLEDDRTDLIETLQN